MSHSAGVPGFDPALTAAEQLYDWGRLHREPRAAGAMVGTGQSERLPRHHPGVFDR